MKPYSDLFRSLANELDPIRLQRLFLKALLELQNVTRGSIWIKSGNCYQCIEAEGEGNEAISGVRIPVESVSIVGWVIENRQMTIADPETDPRHYASAERGLSIKSSLILCFPLFLRDGQVYGAVQIIDTRAGETRLNLQPAYLDEIQSLVDVGSAALSNALIYQRKLEETESLRTELRQIREMPAIVGQSTAFQQARELMEGYARTEYPVLITGDSGTGKELFARQIHLESRRRSKPFLVQNCSAIPETLLESELFGYMKGAFSGAISDRIGLFEAADNGTLFLDEIGDMPLNLQARILRVIQDGEVKPLGANQAKQVDVRIVSATNRDIGQMVANQQFREDLFYRLSVLPLRLPPLSERIEDIPLLLNHYMRQEAATMQVPPKQFSAAALGLLTTYSWAGNVRELQNFVRYALVTIENSEIRAQDLPSAMTGAGQRRRRTDERRPADRFLEQGPGVLENRPLDFGQRSWTDVERAYVLHLMEVHSWNVSRAAQAAQIKRSTFASRMRRLGVKKRR